MRLDTKSGAVAGEANAPPDYDGLDEYSVMQGAKWEMFASDLGEPSGIELHEGRLFVGDHASGDIVAFDLEGHELARAATGASGLAGLAVGPDGKLWFVDSAANELVRIDP
jgi:glucose/arabinose dehydrogenase